MNEDFEKEKLSIFNDHAAKIEEMKNDFADKANLAEQKRLDDLTAQQKEYESQISDIRQANINAAAAVSAKHVTEVKTIQKSVDQRVATEKRNAERKFQFKAKEIQSIANARIQKAEERAEQANSSANESIRAIRGTSDQINRDYVFGSSALLGKLVQKLIQSRDSDASEKIAQAGQSIVSLSACRTDRGIFVTRCVQADTKMLKFCKGSADLTYAFPELHWELSQIEKCPIVITYTGSEDITAKAFEERDVTLIHNKKLKTNGMIAVYFLEK